MKYTISVKYRVKRCTVTVEANDFDEAEIKALDEAYKTVTENLCDYLYDDTTELMHTEK